MFILVEERGGEFREDRTQLLKDLKAILPIGGTIDHFAETTILIIPRCPGVEPSLYSALTLPDSQIGATQVNLTLEY